MYRAVGIFECQPRHLPICMLVPRTLSAFRYVRVCVFFTHANTYIHTYLFLTPVLCAQAVHPADCAHEGRQHRRSLAPRILAHQVRLGDELHLAGPFHARIAGYVYSRYARASTASGAQNKAMTSLPAHQGSQVHASAAITQT
jgi:hypothetical protein